MFEYIQHMVFFFFSATNLLSAVAADFNGETCGGMCIKVLSRSGKVLFRRCRNNKNFVKALTIEMDTIWLGKTREIEDLVPKFQIFEIRCVAKRDCNEALRHGLLQGSKGTSTP